MCTGDMFSLWANTASLDERTLSTGGCCYPQKALKPTPFTYGVTIDYAVQGCTPIGMEAALFIAVGTLASISSGFSASYIDNNQVGHIVAISNKRLCERH